MSRGGVRVGGCRTGEGERGLGWGGTRQHLQSVGVTEGGGGVSEGRKGRTSK